MSAAVPTPLIYWNLSRQTGEFKRQAPYEPYGTVSGEMNLNSDNNSRSRVSLSHLNKELGFVKRLANTKKITSHGNHRENIYEDNERLWFLEILGTLVANYDYNWLCHGYCLMDNHYHLIIETIDGNLPKGILEKKSQVTNKFSPHALYLSLWQDYGEPQVES